MGKFDYWYKMTESEKNAHILKLYDEGQDPTEIAKTFSMSEKEFYSRLNFGRAARLEARKKPFKTPSGASPSRPRSLRRTLGKRKVQIIVTCSMCDGTTFVDDGSEYICVACGYNIGDDPEVYPWKVYQI